MKIDLHLHTNCSDGVYHPEKVLQKIIDAKYDIVSFTDHDSCAAYDILAKYPRPENLRIIKGVEMTTSHQDNEIHILGYFRNGCSEQLKTFLVAAQQERIRRINTGIEGLRKYDINLTYGDLLRFTSGESVGRNHLAGLLVARGHAQSVDEAFDLYLKDEMNAVPQMSTTVRKAIEVIKEADGIPVWAHPPYAHFEEFLPEFVESGLAGIEAYNQKRTLNNCKYYQDIADRYNLLVTAGSDWHGFEQETFLTNYPPEVADKFVALFK